MLTMHLLGLPQAAFVVQGVVPRKENQKRLRNIQTFFADGRCMQALRRASLVLQLTGGVESMMATKNVPSVVRIVNGEAHGSISDRLGHLLGVMHRDPNLELGPATGGLLATACEITLRLNEYLKYPFLLCRMCRLWYTSSFLYECQTFVNADAATLDVGFSMQFRMLALEQGNEFMSIAWLASDEVQACLVDTISNMLVNRWTLSARVRMSSTG